MSINIEDVVIKARPQQISENGKVCVDVHIQEINNNFANNININVFVNAKPNSSIEQIKTLALSEMIAFLERAKANLSF